MHDRLRRLILDGTLPPGSEISQLELSRQLDVSRTPLREALKLLERERLVINRGPHTLIEVSPLTSPDLDDLYSMRVMGEALAIWLTVPTLRQRDLDALHRDLELTMGEQSAEAAAAHRRFHAGLRSGAGPRLAEHLLLLFEHAERYQHAYADREDVDLEIKHREHQAILAACEARDRRLARNLLVDHTAQTAMTLMTLQRFAPFVLPGAIAMAKCAGEPSEPS